MAAKKRSRTGPGLGVGFDNGSPAVDPTENVKALSEALSQRQDDLRDLNNKYLDARLDAMEKAACVRDKNVREISVLRAEHAKEIRHLESDRLEKIRQVDVSNTAITASQQLAAIQTLAASALASADTLRATVSTTAATIQNQTDRIMAAINERLSVLEKTSYTGQGRSAVSDPAMERMVEEMKKLTAAGSVVAGKSAGLGLGASVLIGALSVVLSLLSIASVLYAVLKQ